MDSDDERGVTNAAFTYEADDASINSPPPPHDGADASNGSVTDPDASERASTNSLSRETSRDVCGCRWPCRLSPANFAVSGCRKSRAGGGRGFAPRAVASLLADRDQGTSSRPPTTSTRLSVHSARAAHMGLHRTIEERRISRMRSASTHHSISEVLSDSVNCSSSPNTVLNPELLPDILNSHLPPPPYSTLPQSTERSSRRGANANSVVCPQQSRSFLNPRLSFLAGGGRRGRATHYTPEDEPKHCCGVVVTQTISIRWFIIMIAFVGLCCAVVGTVLGALKTTGREHLTVSLLMIGVGIVLITVSGIAWRLTSTDAPSCRMMLGLRSNEDPEPNRRFVPRIPPSYGRSHHPYAAMMYPEFQFRPPPPSYQASMQEYRLRLLLLDRQHTPTVISPVSPPPTYRSHTSNRQPLSLMRDSDYSRPPSYRSRTSSVLPRPIESTSGNGGEVSQEGRSCHSRDPSLSLSCLSHESLFEVRPLTGSRTVSPLPSAREVHSPIMASNSHCDHNGENIIPSKFSEEDERFVGRSSRSNDSNDNNSPVNVHSGQVVSQDGVVVTVSTSNCPLGGIVQGEVEILAHL